MTSPIRLPMRQLLTETVAGISPEFELLSQQPGYWFRRGPLDLFYQLIVIQSSQQHRCFAVDVAISVFPCWDKAYGCHQMRSATGLQNLRVDSNMTRIEDEVYEYDGSLHGARTTLAAIQSDLGAFALPWFENFTASATNDSLLRFGLAWIDRNRHRIPMGICQQLDLALARGSHRRGRLRNPLLEELKQELRRYANDINASNWHRKETAILAMDLLRYVGDVLLAKNVDS